MNVFNPIRPMDHGAQPDADNDGIGDACDKCPLDAGETCAAPSAEDRDGDGIPTGVDNCPYDPNPDQTDADGDGKGAVCDKDAAGGSCDDKPNPGDQLCPSSFTIAMLRNQSDPGHPKAGATRATLTGVYVTAVKASGAGTFGFFIQQGTDQWSGMFVATPNVTPAVKVGNKIDIEGSYEEAFDLSQLSDPKITVVDDGTTLPFDPVEIDPAVYASTVNKGAAGEPWESMLCVVKGPIAVSVVNPDDPKDFDEFAVGAANLRVDDNLDDPLDNTFPIGTSFDKIVGICGYSFSNRKIWPRGDADIPKTP
jgi:hypothetical protein